MKKGGKLLGKGAHGCAIFDKPILCSSKQETDDKLIKLLVDKEDFLEEINNTLLVNFIDKGKTTIKIEDSCIIDIEKILSDEDKEKILECNFKKDDIIDNKIYQIIYNKKDIGVDLTKLVELNEVPIEKILAMSLRLYESLFLYDKYEICFADIKPDNVIYLKKSDKLKFIDYGLMSNYNKILTRKDMLNYDYPYYPPEFKLIDCILTDKKFADFHNVFIKNFMFQETKELKENLFKIYPDYQTDLHNMYYYYLDLKDKNSNFNMKEFFTNEDKAKIHLYSLSILLLSVISIYNSKEFVIKDVKFVTDFIKNILLPSISFNLQKRITTEECINRIKSLKSKLKDINKIIKSENLLETINSAKKFKSKSPREKLQSQSPTSSEEDREDVVNYISRCNKTKSYYLLLAKKYKIKNRYKMTKHELCEALHDKYVS
jgi:serine/threonine protein kinase